MDNNSAARNEIFMNLRSALESFSGSPLSPMPKSARFDARDADKPEKEIQSMLHEVTRLSGFARMVRGREEFAAAMKALAGEETVRSAVLSAHPLLEKYGVVELLQDCGITIAPPDGDRGQLAECDLGITVADAALPETGTSLLRTQQGQPDFLSLLPRVHLVLAAPEALLADLHEAFALAKADRHFVLVSGSSRTADIEKVLTLGAHGPKSFHFWLCS